MASCVTRGLRSYQSLDLKAPLDKGSDVYGPLQVPVNTNFEHMGVMENPRKNALQLSSLPMPNSYDGM